MNNAKIEQSIQLLCKGEKLALALNPRGYMVAFSGGKDSVVMLDIVRRANVKHFVVHSVTGIDSPETMRFMRDNYPEIEYTHSKDNCIRLIEKSGLPTMLKRFCCEKVKENIGAGCAVLVGVRAAESKKRAQGSQVEVYSRRRENIEKGRKRTLDEIYQNEHQCIKGQDRLMIKPIFNWTDAEVWEYTAKRGLPINPQYSDVGRVGCMFCPFASKAQIEYYEQRYPLYKKRIMLALHRYWARCSEHILSTPEEYYEWWKSKKSLARFRQQN